jgi:predicted 3-demethylubiquinone-9 3-methyltransferase (glyoxalase superfamily)
MQKLYPMLWFDDQAEQAAEHYVAVFSHRPGPKRGESKVIEVSHYGEAGPRPAGMAMVVRFAIEGQEFTALNGGPDFTFNEAVSFVIECDDQQEVDYFWKALTEGGQEIECGWLKDRFGLRWQVVPTALFRMQNDPDQEKAQRAMAAMLQMTKLDLRELERAFNGEAVGSSGRKA